jgi:GAF domain-containing protein
MAHVAPSRIRDAPAMRRRYERHARRDAVTGAPEAMAALMVLSRARGDARPDDVFRAADAAARALIGHELFTVMRFDPSRWIVERLYSSAPDSYPAGGRKAKRDAGWGRQVLRDGRPYVGGGPDAIAWAFDDAAKILALGLDQVANMPVLSERRVVGTVNILRGGAPFTENDVDRLRNIAALTAPAIERSVEPDTSP